MREHPSGVDPDRFDLIAPYESDPERWTELEWIDQYSGDSYRVTTDGHHGGRSVARIKTYGDVVRGIRMASGNKVRGCERRTGEQQTVGLLHRKHVSVDHLIYIGRESNQREDVDAGLVRASDGLTHRALLIMYTRRRGLLS